MPQPRPDSNRRRPTIADVARRAGVSAAAVSFAVNDRPGVSPETKERILVAARELGWQPSAAARALTEARTRAIGLVLARDAAQLEVDAFFVRFLSGIERALTAVDYALLLQIVPGDPLPAYERLVAAGRVDGFLLTDIEAGDPRFSVLENAGVPVVVAGRPRDGECPFPWLETRHDEGMAAPVRHLVELGHHSIGFLGERADYEHVRVRLDVWRETLAAHGLPEGPVVHVKDDAAAAAAELLEGEPTAVVCSSDVVAMALIAAARARGLAVPDDLSVTGFDDSPVAALAGLTSVRVDYAEFGQAAAGSLLAAIGVSEQPAYSPSPPELAVRASTARRRRR